MIKTFDGMLWMVGVGGGRWQTPKGATSHIRRLAITPGAYLDGLLESHTQVACNASSEDELGRARIEEDT